VGQVMLPPGWGLSVLFKNFDYKLRFTISLQYYICTRIAAWLSNLVQKDMRDIYKVCLSEAKWKKPIHSQ